MELHLGEVLYHLCKRIQLLDQRLWGGGIDVKLGKEPSGV